MKYRDQVTIRIFKFAVSAILLRRRITNDSETRVINSHLTKSSKSNRAASKEVYTASSKVDFDKKLRISLKGMRETNYWFELLYQIKANKKLEQESSHRSNNKDQT